MYTQQHRWRPLSAARRRRHPSPLSPAGVRLHRVRHDRLLLCVL